MRLDRRVAQELEMQTAVVASRASLLRPEIGIRVREDIRYMTADGAGFSCLLYLW